jgi:regulator of replication initiation timing
MSDDDLTIAYQLGVEDMRSKLHKQADEIERLRAENEMLKSNLPARAATRGLAEQHNEITRLRAENEKLREALKPFADAVTDEYSWKYDINSDDFRAAAAAIREIGE